MIQDFSQALIRCSALGAVFTEPQAKAAKEAGELSETAKAYLVKIYIKEKYGREYDIITKYMEKGKTVEEQSIAMFSLLQQKEFNKNEDRLSNGIISGTPDVFEGEKIEEATAIWDIKSSWNLETFLANVSKPLDKGYFYQLQGYYWLTGAETGGIVYCLTNTPESLLNDEKYRLLKRMDVVSEESPSFIRASAQLEHNNLFDDIPISERCLKFEVARNEEIIKKIPEKVEKCRTFLQEFQEKHLEFNKNTYIALK